MSDYADVLPTEQDAARFARDGAVVIRGLFRDFVERLRDGVDQIMADPSPLRRIYHPEGDDAPFFQDMCNWQRIESFKALVLTSAGGEAAARLTRSKQTRFFHDHLLVKEPGTSVVTPFHQDLPFYSVAGRKTVSFWIPLDPVPKAMSLECVAGSHCWSIFKAQRFDGTDLYQEDEAIELPDIQGNRDDYKILSWDMEPGDAVAFNFGTAHGAAAISATANRRRVVSARFVGDDAVFVDRRGKSSPPFPHITLRTGEPLRGPDFPVTFGG